MYILVFTLVLTGQTAVWSGQGGQGKEGKWTTFESKDQCMVIRNPEFERMMKQKEAKPTLGDFTLECVVKPDLMDNEHS